MAKDEKLLGWKDLPIGGIIVGGATSASVQTGEWRVKKPVIDLNRCIHCMFCWVYCPDDAIIVEDGKMKGFDYDHCKGCGVCAEECPPKVKCIDMIEEEI